MYPRVALIGALLLAAASARVDADPMDGLSIPEKARLLADRGRQLQRDGKFADALEAYKAAYVLAPSPGLLFNLAQAYRLNGDCDDAVWMYRRFLETEPRDDLKDLVNAHLQKLQACAHNGFRAQVEPGVVPDATNVRPAAMPSQPKKLPPAPELPGADDEGAGKRHAGTYLMIGGGVALAASVVFAIDSHVASNDVADAYRGGARNPDVGSLDDRGHRDDTISAVTGVVGGAAVITGAVLYGMGRRSEHVAVVPHKDGGEVRVAWHF